MPVASLIAAGWSAGLNAYLTVGILGMAGRLGWADQVPSALQQTWVLVAAGALFALEFVIDKVPLLDSAWDMVHTLVRPSVAGWVGASMAGQQIGRPWASALAAGLALVGHTTKATSRLAINLSPEPLTNIVASFAEDGVVGVVVALALANPKVAAVVAVAAAIIGVIVAASLFRLARRGWRRVRRWLSGQAATRQPAT